MRVLEIGRQEFQANVTLPRPKAPKSCKEKENVRGCVRRVSESFLTSSLAVQVRPAPTSYLAAAVP